MNEAAVPDDVLSESQLPDQRVADVLGQLEQKLSKLVRHIRSAAAPPDGRSRDLLSMRPTDVAKLLGRSESWLRALDKDSAVARDTSNARVYWPADVTAIRHERRVEPLPPEGSSAHVLAVINQKGGAAKTTTALNLAHDLGSRGYRVMILDLDPQASMTSSLLLENDDGILVEGSTLGLEAEQTACFVLSGDHTTFDGLVRKTHWPNISIVPASPDLQEAEMAMIETLLEDQAAQRASRFWGALRSACRAVPSSEFDFIVIDTPPSLSLATVCIALAANGLLVPVPPRNLDIESLKGFIRTTNAWMKSIQARFGTDASWIRFLLTIHRKDSRAETRNELLMRRHLGRFVLENTVPRMEALERGSGAAPSVFEASPPSPRSAARAATDARKVLREVHDEILEIVGKTWARETKLQEAKA